MKISRIQRVIKLMVALQSKQYRNADHLAASLNISRRTLYRDLNELRRAGIPCRFNRKTNTFDIDSRFFLKSPALNRHEAVSLLMLAHKAAHFLNAPFRNSLLQSALKVENTLQPNVRVFCRKALDHISVLAEPHHDIIELDKQFDILLNAVVRDQSLTVTTCEYSSQTQKTYAIEPYELVYKNNQWHLVGKTPPGPHMRLIPFSDLRRIVNRGRHFVRDELFNIHDFLGRAWSTQPEGQLHHVRLKFSPAVAEKTNATQWHTTQESFFMDDGSLIMDFRVDGLSEITWWILSFGNEAEVLAPEKLRRKIAEIAQQMVQVNSISP